MKTNTITQIIAWVCTTAAVIAGVIIIGSPFCLFGMTAPCLITMAYDWRHVETVSKKREEKSEDSIDINTAIVAALEEAMDRDDRYVSVHMSGNDICVSMTPISTDDAFTLDDLDGAVAGPGEEK